MSPLQLAIPLTLSLLGSLSSQTLEVFFLAGQSNADGSNSYYLDSGDTSKGGGLSAANASYADPYAGVQYAHVHANPFEPPVNRYYTGALGALRPATWGMMGPELSLGRELDVLHMNDVALLKYTSPGTSLNTQWGPDDGLLYQDMLAFYGAQLSSLAASYTQVNLNAFFWHQGESDSGLTYEADFLAMFDQLKIDLAAPNLNAVMGLISENFDPGATGVTPRSNIAAVNAAIESMATARGDITNTGSLTDIPLHDNIHFDANGQIIHGERMAAAYQSEFMTIPEPSVLLLSFVSLAVGLKRRRS